MSRPWSKSVDVIIQFNQLLNEAFVWCNRPLAPEKITENEERIRKSSKIEMNKYTSDIH